MLLKHSLLNNVRSKRCLWLWVKRNFSERTDEGVAEKFRHVMSKVPNPVVVVTTAVQDTATQQWKKRGVTCSSFTSISLQPPIVSFAITKHSRMHGLLMDRDNFAIHVLAKNQVAHGVHFSKPAEDGIDQFKNIPHEMDQQDIPIIRDSSAVVMCRAHSVHTIGDHHVWYGQVLHAYSNGHIDETLLYYARSFRSVGDEAFLQAFEDTTLPFVDWTHEAHLRMAWNYIREHGRQAAIPLIKHGIRNYNEQNADKIGRGYHETVTMFYINVIHDAINSYAHEPAGSFEDFVKQHEYIMDRNLLFKYYSDEHINRKEAKEQFLPPDKLKRQHWAS